MANHQQRYRIGTASGHRKWVYIAVGLIGAFIVLVIPIVARFERPPFTVGLRLITPGGPGWGPPLSTTIDDHSGVFIDLTDNVIMIVPISKSGNYGWVPNLKRVGTSLVLRSFDTGAEREIEWRRDCMISVSVEGSPEYTSISPKAFDLIRVDGATPTVVQRVHGTPIAPNDKR